MKTKLALTMVVLAASCAHLSWGHEDGRIEPVANLAVQAGFAPNVTYDVVDGLELKLDVMVPRIDLGEDPWWAFDGKKKPTLLYIHGGGLMDGEKETRQLLLLPFVARGWVVVNINYRLAGQAKAPGAIVDCRKALSWIYDHAEEYQMDTSRIVVSGESAGGYLALMTGMLTKGDSLCGGKYIVPGNKNVAAIISWYGGGGEWSAESMKGHLWFDPADDLGVAVRSLSPVTYISKDNPPILSIQGEDDPLTKAVYAEKLHERLDDAGVKNKLVLIPGAKHGNFSSEDRTRIFEEIWAFMGEAGVEMAD